MVRRASAGRFWAEWDGAARRWHVYGPGSGPTPLLSLPGDREAIVAFLRLMGGLPANLAALPGKGKGALLMAQALTRQHGPQCRQPCCRRPTVPRCRPHRRSPVATQPQLV
jgi:hypothetical protein